MNATVTANRPTGVRLPMPGGPILLATDGSEDALTAGLAACKIDAVLNAGIRVVHCWMPPSSPYSLAGAMNIDVHQAFEMPAGEVLRAEVARLQHRDARVAGADLLEGPAFDLISNLADRVDTPLIVIGSRGLGAVKRMMLGSVSEGVVHHAHRPVLVVRGGTRSWPPRVIIVGDDGSAEARTAALTAASVAAAVGARLRLVAVIPCSWMEASSPGDARRAEASRLASQEMLSELASHVAETSGVRPATSVLVGDPGATLVAEARGDARPAMIAVGSRGMGAMRRLTLGSVSTRILHSAPASVLICPR